MCSRNFVYKRAQWVLSGKLRSFFRDNDFESEDTISLNSRKVYSKCEASMSAYIIQEEKIEIEDETRNAIILCLRDKLLREVSKKKTTTLMWEKIE